MLFVWGYTLVMVIIIGIVLRWLLKKVPAHAGAGGDCTIAESALPWSSTPRVPPNQRGKDREFSVNLQGFFKIFVGVKLYLKLFQTKFTPYSWG